MHKRDHAEDNARKLANNHAKFESFGWSSDAQPEGKHLWTIVYTTNRDADACTRSNHRIITRTLAPWTGDHKEGASVESISHSHWACGYVDGFLIRVYDASGAITDAFTAYSEMVDSLADYPILSDEDFSQEESTEADQVWEQCYKTDARIEYIRDNRSQFEFQSFADMLGCVRGKYFAGYASELLG